MECRTRLSLTACAGISVVGSAALGLTPPSAAVPPTFSRTPDDSLIRPGVVLDARVWPSFAGGPGNVSVAHNGALGPATISSERFVFDGNQERKFVFFGQTALVVSDELVIGLGFEIGGFRGQAVPVSRVAMDVSGGDGDKPADASLVGDARPNGGDSVIAVSRIDGSLVWEAPIPAALLDSWSSPAIDPGSRTVVVGSGSTLNGFDLDTGASLWSTDLGRIIVNASPVITNDRPGRNRVFITDYSFASSVGGRLFCVNIDPFDVDRNPFKPGEVVWSAELSGETAGNTPGYADGMVYVSIASGGQTWDQGTILAYDADATLTPAPEWVYELDNPSGFFSGVAIKGDAVYASSYSFSGGQFSGRTVRVDRHSGQGVWSVPTNRTDTIPVPIDGGLVLVSGGVPFSPQLPSFGSIPSIQLIAEFPWGGAVRLWDSGLDTLDDANQNGRWDPGEDFLSLGGWTIQPAVLESDGNVFAYVGVSPDPASSLDGFFAASPAMAMVDLSKAPDDHGFVVEWYHGAGASPAISRGELYSVGYDGVFAFGAPSISMERILMLWTSGLLPDLNSDGMANFYDLRLAVENAIR